MTRSALTLPGLNPEYYTSANIYESALLDMTRWRDEWRAAFIADGVTADMVASDIFTWTGSSNFTGYGFVLRNKTKNSNLYVLNGGNHTTAPDVDDWLGASGSNLRQHVTALNDSGDGTTSPGNGIVMIFNPDTTVAEADLDWDDATALTYTGGDGTALTTINPDSIGGLAALRPSHALKGIEYSTLFTSSTGLYVSFDMCYNPDLNTWFVHTKAQGAETTRYVSAFGEFIVPTGGDTNKNGVLKAKTSHSGFSMGTMEYCAVHAFDGGSVERVYEVTELEIFTRLNYKINNPGSPDHNKLDWRAPLVTNGSGGAGTKGDLHEEFCVEAYPFADASFKGRPIFMPDATKPLFKYSEGLCFMWKQGVSLPGSYSRGGPH